MPTRTVRIASRSGLHARPAALFTQAAAAQPVAVRLAPPGGTPVDAASILMIMSLGLGHGAEVELSADGEGADAALDRLAALLGTDLDAVPDGAAAEGAGA
jgi:phosphocarrier protein